MKEFWRQFLAQDNSQVHTPYAAMLIAFVLATPIVLLSCAAVVKHIFINSRPLDGPTVNLLLGMLGAATGGIIGAGATTFARSSVSQFTSMGSPTLGKPLEKPLKPECGET